MTLRGANDLLGRDPDEGKTMRTSVYLSAAVGVGAALILAACSGTDGEQSGSATANPDELGPLDKYLSSMWEGEEWTQEKYDAETLEREDMIAQCMAKDGFDYTPNLENGTTFVSDDGDVNAISWDSLEYAQIYGYGAIDWPGRPEEEAAWED